MTDLTRPDRGEATRRLADSIKDLDDSEAVGYLLICMGILAKNAPDVATFVQDRADEALERIPTAGAPR